MKKLLVTIHNGRTLKKKIKIKYRNIGAEVPKVPKERIRLLHIRIFKNIVKGKINWALHSRLNVQPLQRK